MLADASPRGGKTSIVRWGYLAPRLLVLALLLVALEWGTGWVVAWIVVPSLNRLPGVELKLGRPHAGALSGRWSASPVHLTVQRGDKRLGIRAARVQGRVDARWLFRKKFVVESGFLDGLDLSCDHGPDGGDDGAEGKAFWGGLFAEKRDAARRRVESWLAASQLRGRALVAEESQTVKTVQQMETTWRLRRDRWTEAATLFEDALRQLRDDWRAVENASRAEQLARMAPHAATLQRLGQQLEALRREGSRLPEVVRADRKRLDDAFRLDMQQARRALEAVKPTSAADLADAMLDALATRYIRPVVPWVERARVLGRWIGYRPRFNELGNRGRDIVFDNSNVPNVWIRQMALRGSLKANDRLYTFAGVLRDWSPEPARLDRPTRLAVRVDAPIRLRIRWQGDGAARSASSLLAIDIEPVRLKEARFEVGDGLGWRLETGMLTGKIVARDAGGGRTVRGTFEFAGLSGALEGDALRQLLPQARLQLAWERPLAVSWEWHRRGEREDRAVRTNLASLLRPALTKAFEAAAAERLKQYEAALGRKKQAQLESVERFVRAQAAKLDEWEALIDPLRQVLKLDPTAALRRIWR